MVCMCVCFQTRLNTVIQNLVNVAKKKRKKKQEKFQRPRVSEVRLLQLPCNRAIPIPRQMKPNGGDRTCRDAFVAEVVEVKVK